MSETTRGKFSAWLNDKKATSAAAVEGIREQKAEYDRLAASIDAKQAARKAARRPEPSGKLKTPQGVIAFRNGEVYYHADREMTIPLEEIATVSLDDGAALESRSTLTRTGGGALAGAVLLGPVGMLAGLGLGAVAKKKSGGERFVVVDSNAATIVLEVPRKQVSEATRFVADLKTAIKEKMR